ncbi:MAG: tyrosinase family protein, partial [Holophagales bacterium]|nr:tyrosinase family protein [Holophagales bacterium]
TPVPLQEAWQTCQHGQFFFLAWHRMYLYYFERILQAAVREATGEPDYELNLPYWDYENPSFHPLPEPFRVPADSSNSLYVSQRAADCNDGGICVSAEEADATQALSLIPICNCESAAGCPTGTPDAAGCVPGLLPDETFGGQYTPVPEHALRNFGELESQPHNVVHDAIGGEYGWMAYVECAARDPIFWLHHANIDRLWQVWLNQGGERSNPLGVESWRDQKFVFFDENKQRVEMTGCQVLDMATQLDYVYPDTPVDNVVLCDETAAPAAPAPAASPELTTLAASQPSAVSLGRDPVRVSVDVPTLAERLAADGSGRIRVVIEGLELVRPGGIFQVYLNLPEGQEADPESLYYLGHIAVFGHIHEGLAGRRSFDVTDKIRALRRDGEWSGSVELTFVRSNPEAASAETASNELLRFSHVSVVARP